MAYDPAMATVSRGEALNLRFTAGEPRALRLLQYELGKAGVAAEFATDTDRPGRKDVGDLVSILVVAVATLAEARKIITVLVDARLRSAQTVRASVDEIEVTNADPAQIEKIIEGHFRADRELPGPGRAGA
jgi:hypothetical protein